MLPRDSLFSFLFLLLCVHCHGDAQYGAYDVLIGGDGIDDIASGEGDNFVASGDADLDGDGKMDAALVKEFMDEHDINNKDIFNDDETV